MKANYKDKIPKKESEVSLGNLYDMNKQMMAQEPELDEEALLTKGALLTDWIRTHAAQQYFMMLCHERRDYTVFNIRPRMTGISINQINSMVGDVVECLKNRGTLVGMDLQDDGVWEFWINDEGECFAFYLFPYGPAVLEY